ncbi:hypothetical protein D9756_001972 [Leucocoprinus leucothites]|uniref:Uncharacterized protein n=1 Tax=Leucocoprinus leucothites TaxID=201217 RepID=A0A8H5G4D7_9AGAR|nr:hypothetical protein D9756_001972 [Leucoagaricus leucothites]
MSWEDISSHGCEKSSSLLPLSPTTGTHKVKYHAHEDSDFVLHVDHTPVDLALIMPHYRALHQPIGHKLSMDIRNRSAPTKLKVCRNVPLTRFHLEVFCDTSDVTLWIPSDFKGRIFHTGKATFSAGFVNRIMRNARINEPFDDARPHEDDVFVYTRGHITFRMWDIQIRAPENAPKESLKRLFGCARRAPETAINWDFLIED